MIYTAHGCQCNTYVYSEELEKKEKISIEVFCQLQEIWNKLDTMEMP